MTHNYSVLSKLENYYKIKSEISKSHQNGRKFSQPLGVDSNAFGLSKQFEREMSATDLKPRRKTRLVCLTTHNKVFSPVGKLVTDGILLPT